MSASHVRARWYATGQPMDVRWREGVLVEWTPLAESAEPLPWIAPGLVDLQVNGFAGVDFQADDLAREDLIRATRALGRFGCHRFFLTLVTDRWDRMLNRLERLKRWRDETPELMEAIAGWHLEGPFLSSAPGFRGSHDPAALEDPRPEALDLSRDLTRGDRVLLTLAPERAGALRAIAHAVSLGFRVFLGHTNAPAGLLREAELAGASGFTHLGNGCPVDLNRFDNILWRVLDRPLAAVSLVPDGAHVSPALFRLFHRLLPPRCVVYVTDAMAAAGAPPGAYRLGRLALEVGADRVVRLPGTPNLAGSALTPVEGVFRAARMLGRPWQRVWPAFSENPARGWSLDTALGVGMPANFVLLEAMPEDEGWRIQSLARGEARESIEIGSREADAPAV